MTNTGTIALGVLSLGMLPACGSGYGEMFSSSTADEPGEGPPDAREDEGRVGPLPPSVQVTRGPASLVGVTSDGYAVYRPADQTLLAVALHGGAPSLLITDHPGAIVIKHRAVFNWADVDWTTNLGHLSVWTAAGGARESGVALYSEDMVAATEDGTTMVFNANVTPTTTDLVIASNDFSAPSTLIAGVGRGSEGTCRSSFGFVGSRLLIGWCAPGSQFGKIERYELLHGQWTGEVIASDSLSTWSSDRAGELIFYQANDYRGRLVEAGESRVVDASVSSGIVLPDGSAILYNVSDQLRRTALPEINPIPIVTRGFAQLAEFSPSYDHVLYSRQVTYEGGTKRDLMLSDTSIFNPQPTELVAGPTAGLSRSAFTTDGQYAIYLTDLNARGSTLNIYSVASGKVRTFPNVDTVLAAGKATIVFSDHRSDPDKYPIVADLNVLDAATDGPPQLLEAMIVDGRSFFADPDAGWVSYVRSGLDFDANDPEAQGVFVRSSR
jgi:hypothetical protein